MCERCHIIVAIRVRPSETAIAKGTTEKIEVDSQNLPEKKVSPPPE